MQIRKDTNMITVSAMNYGIFWDDDYSGTITERKFETYEEAKAYINQVNESTDEPICWQITEDQQCIPQT